jgi:hypothetical protein
MKMNFKPNIARLKAQVTFEYLVILGVVMAMLLPAVYLFYSNGQANSNLVAVERLTEIGNNLLASSEYVYPFGSGSKTTLEFDSIRGVSNITVKGQGNPLGTELVINLEMNGANQSLVFFSKYSLFIGNCSSAKPFTSNFVTQPGKKTFQVISCGSNVSIYEKEN